MQTKHLAWCGLLAPLLLGVALLGVTLLRPDYSQLAQAISELGMPGAPFAAAWNGVGFLLVGALIVAFAWGLRRGTGRRLVPALVAASGLGWMGLGLAPAAVGFARSPQTTLHFVMVALNFLPFLVGAFAFALQQRAHPRWRRWAGLSALIGLIALGSFFIPATVPAGLSQRIGIGAYFVWIMALGYALLRQRSAG